MADETEKWTIYTPPGLKARLAAIAEHERRTTNAQVCLMLELAADQMEMQLVRAKVEGVPPKTGAVSAVFATSEPPRLLPHGKVLPRGDALVEIPSIPPVPEPPRFQSQRTTTCHHNKRPDEYCAVCDS